MKYNINLDTICIVFSNPIEAEHNASGEEEKMEKKIILLFISFLLAGVLQATILNIPADYPTIQTGIDSSSNGDTVLVQPGTYVENINYNGKNITVASLFLTTQDTSYISQTVIDGGGVGKVIWFENNEDLNARLTGFIITNGYQDWGDGGGIYIDNANPTLDNLKIEDNYASLQGGGLCCSSNSNPIISNVVFKDNYGHSAGGGITCRGNSNPLIMNCSFIENRSCYGGGVYCINSDPTLINVKIIGNWLYDYGSGGGIACENSDPIIKNAVIANNSASSSGAGIRCYNSSPSFINATIFKNLFGGGIWVNDDSYPTFTNCIIWDNSPYQISGNPTIEYSDVEDGWVGLGIIVSNPMLVDPNNFNYHLSQDSPCIDTGKPDTTGLHLPPWDMDGNVRVWDGNGDGIAVIDMGAYEYAAPPYSIDPPDIQNTRIIYNFPNPVINSTTIHYTIKQNSHVTISIYNIKGQLISILINEEKPKGEHSVIYNTEKLKSGVYFYKLQTEKLTDIKKLVVIQ